MRSFLKTSSLSAFLPLALLAGCSSAVLDGSGGPESPLADDPALAEGEGVASSEAALVAPTAPYYRGTPYSGEVPALRDATRAFAFPEAAASATGRTDVHGGRFSSALDHAAAPVTATGSAVDASLNAWLGRVRGDDANTSPRFADASVSGATLPAAIAAARAGASVDWGELDAILAGIPASFGPVRVEPSQTVSLAFAPERARWLKAQTVTGGTTPSLGDSRYEYPAPAQLDELRLRAARMYCSAKETYRRGRSLYGSTARVMGRKSAARFDIMGVPFELFTVEPTVALKAPRKFAANEADGAQAFTIPMEVGARIAPANFLPSLPEMRVPVAVVTGDSEVMSRSDVGPVRKVRFERVGSTWVPRWYTVDEPRKDTQTVTHAFAYLAGQKSVSVDAPPITLFTLGPVSARLRLGMDLYSRATAGNNERLVARGPAGWPFPRSGGWTLPPVETQSRVFDGAWQLSSYAPTTSLVTVAGLLGTTPPRMALQPTDPFFTRALQNDDHGIIVENGGALRASLEAFGGADLGVIEVGLSLGGGVNGSAAVQHHVREQEEMVTRLFAGTEFDSHSPTPATSLTVSPGLKAQLDATMDGRFILKIKGIPFIGTLDLSFDLFNIRAPLARGEEVWGENGRLRMGTGSNFDEAPFDATPADIMSKPDVRSHWPDTGAASRSYASFPRDVASCLAEPEETPAEPPTCGGRGATGPATAPDVNVCAYYPVNWTGEFGPASTPAQHACIARVQSFVRGGTTRRQAFARDWTMNGTTSRYSQSVDARVVPMTASNPAHTEWQRIIGECATAYGGDEARLREVIYAGPCTRDATLVDSVIRVPDASERPATDPTSSAGTCR